MSCGVTRAFVWSVKIHRFLLLSVFITSSLFKERLTRLRASANHRPASPMISATGFRNRVPTFKGSIPLFRKFLQLGERCSCTRCRRGVVPLVTLCVLGLWSTMEASVDTIRVYVCRWSQGKHQGRVNN